MLIKTARAEIGTLFKAAEAEQQANLRQAQLNALTMRAEDKKAYSSQAFRGLIRGVNDLLALVEEPATS